MRFFWVREKHERISIHDSHKWGLPGLLCPTCKVESGAGAIYLPCVDLSGLPDEKKLRGSYLETDYNEFIRLREVVRPLVPEGIELRPGVRFGPAIGPASGTNFGALTMGFPWMMLARPEGVAFLRDAGIRGIKACRTELRFKRKPQEVLELQIDPRGQAHPDCLPRDRRPTCTTCGRPDYSLPNPLILDLASLPTDRDIFRLMDVTTVIVVTEPFVEAVKHLGCDDLAFIELETRDPVIH